MSRSHDGPVPLEIGQAIQSLCQIFPGTQAKRQTVQVGWAMVDRLSTFVNVSAMRSIVEFLRNDDSQTCVTEAVHEVDHLILTLQDIDSMYARFDIFLWVDRPGIASLDNHEGFFGMSAWAFPINDHRIFRLHSFLPSPRTRARHLEGRPHRAKQVLGRPLVGWFGFRSHAKPSRAPFVSSVKETDVRVLHKNTHINHGRRKLIRRVKFISFK